MKSLVEKGSPHEWYRFARYLFGEPDPDNGFGAGIHAVMTKMLFKPTVSGSSTLAAPIQKSMFNFDNPPASHFEEVLKTFTKGPNIDIVGRLEIADADLGFQLLSTMLMLNLSVFGADHFTLSDISRGNFRWLRIRPAHEYSPGENGLNVIPIQSQDTHIGHSSLRLAMQKTLMVDERGHLAIPDTVEYVGEIDFPNFETLGNALFYASKTALTLARQPDIGYLRPNHNFSKRPLIFNAYKALSTAVNFSLADMQNHESTMEVIDRLDIARCFNANTADQVIQQISPNSYPDQFIKLLAYYLPIPMHTLIRQLNKTPNDTIHTQLVPTDPGHLFSTSCRSLYLEALDAIGVILHRSTSQVELTRDDFSAISSDARVLRNPPIFT